MDAADELLRIDEARAAKDLEKYIKARVKKDKSKGILIGLSGGIDSALLAALSSRAVGREKVVLYYLPDRDSDKIYRTKAHEVADWLEIELHVRDFKSIMRERGVYSPAIMKASAFSRFVNRQFINNTYKFMFRESPFLSTLKDGGGQLDGGFLKHMMFKGTVQHIEKGFNARHRYRREFLERLAGDESLLLLGGANRSEGSVGWFVKDGVDDLPIMPLLGLYKTQIWQLSRYLKVPDDVIDQVPSPDMAKGITDEFAMGVDYKKVDIVMDCTERGLSDEEIMAFDITRKELKLIRDIHKYSEWKRETHHEDPPVDGGPNGGYRVTL